MNFLAHLWLAERTHTPAAGAILADLVRGADLSRFPPELAASIRLHRRVDAVCDRHALALAARRRFAAGARRYAGVILDVVYDHALALDWQVFADESLAGFIARSAREVVAEERWFAGSRWPQPRQREIAGLLSSYAEAAGIDRAFARMSRRLSRPELLVAAARGWRDHLAGARADLPVLLRDVLSGIQAA